MDTHPGRPRHTQAVIISTGDEVTIGQLLDTNAQFIANALTGRGVLPVRHVTVPDELPVLAQTLRAACMEASLVVVSGGLGPTDGDLTRQAVAELTGDTLVLDEQARAAIEAMLAKRGRMMSERQTRQAMRPSRGSILENLIGTAPGLHAVVRTDPGQRETDVFCLPGPPGELVPMFEREVVQRLRVDPRRVVIARLRHIVGMAEADCVTRLGDLTGRANMPLVGITASGGVLTLRIRYEGEATRAEAEREVMRVEDAAAHALGDHLIGGFGRASGERGGAGEASAGMLMRAARPDAPGWEMLVRRVLDELIAREQTLAAAESCTGGMLGELVTSVSGSSAAFVGGYVTYANSMKVELGVDTEVLMRHGAVSAETAMQMAARARARSGATHALAITGIAGPDGATPGKPVGTVFIARCSGECASTQQGSEVRRFHFAGNREDVRRRSAINALTMLYFHLRGRGRGEPRLLWEVTE